MEKITIALLIITLLASSITVYASSYSSTPENCQYKSTHGTHNPHASTMECKTYTYPDYTIGQLVWTSYFECTGCPYVCCLETNNFGQLLGEEHLNCETE